MYAQKKENEKKLYGYKGAIMVFEDVVESNWKAQTMAVSARKAKSNLAYQAKRYLGLVAATRVSLPAKVVLL